MLYSCTHVATVGVKGLPYGYSCKASCTRPVEAVICNFLTSGHSDAPGTLALSPERQSARMSKITNEGLTGAQSGTRCFIGVPIWQRWASKGCHMDTATKHPVPDQVKLSFVIFDIRALCRSALSVRVPGCQK